MPQLIWDLPTRIFHWALTFSVLFAYALPMVARRGSVLFGIHIVCGVIAGLLLLWRLVWGCIGSKHARFRSLLFSMTEVKGYVMSVVRGTRTHYAGHNPGSALVIWGMFAFLVVVLVSGLLANPGGRTVREIHGITPNILLALVTLHIVGVSLASYRNKENYVASLLSGLKNGRPEEAIPQSHPVAALVMTALVVLGSSYFVGGFDYATGVFSPPGTSISVRLTPPPRARAPRPVEESERSAPEQEGQPRKAM
jgi:cytochrome b